MAKASELKIKSNSCFRNIDNIDEKMAIPSSPDTMKDIQSIEKEAVETNLAIKNAILSGESDVQKFYDDAVVFLTGGSGFLGKHLIEKLLRSSNVRKIYVLIRSKKGKTAQQRLNIILEDPIYESLHKDEPNSVHKIVPVEGDTAEVSFGLDGQDWSMLVDEVNIILHAAATINFRESFKTATLTNIRGVREMLNLAKACKHIKSVVHVSTAYANATYSRVNGKVSEEIYHSPIPPDALIELAESMDENMLNSMIEPISKDWPNSYTFTKAVAEDLVRIQGKGLPICIVRPAIVAAAYREPLLGWVDVKHAFGPSGIIIGMGLGVIHTLKVKEEINFDLVPVDIVNNTILVAAWETFTSHAEENKQIVYTVTGTRKPFTMRSFVSIVGNEGRSLVSVKTMWYCFCPVTRYKILYLLLTWLLHFIPGMIIDGLCRLIGEKPRLLKVYKMVDSLSSVFEYFTCNSWNFEDSNTHSLHNKLSDTDRLIYNCDMTTVDMKEFVFVWCYGARKYIVKDDMKTVEYAIKKQWWLKIVHCIVLPLYLYALYKLGYLLYSFFMVLVF